MQQSPNINLGPFQCKASSILTLYRELGCDWRLLLPQIWDFQVQYEGPSAFLAGSALPRRLMQAGEELFGCQFREHGGSQWEAMQAEDNGWRVLTTDMYHLEFSRHYQARHLIHFVVVRLDQEDMESVKFHDPLLDVHGKLERATLREAFVPVSADLLEDVATQYGSFYTVTAPTRTGYSSEETRSLLIRDLLAMGDAYRDQGSRILEGLSRKVAEMSQAEFAAGFAEWLLERTAHLPTARAFLQHLFTETDVVPVEHRERLESELTEIVQAWWRSMYLLSRFKSAGRDQDREALARNLLWTAERERAYLEGLSSVWLTN